MRRIARANEYLLHLNIELIISICSVLLEKSFMDFSNFFQVWSLYQTRAEISYLLHHLDWTHMHTFDTNGLTPQGVRFSLFLHDCKNLGINHALCYDACKNLMSGHQPLDNLQILHTISDNHSLSFLAYFIFKPFYQNTSPEESASNLYNKFLTSMHFRSNLVNNCVILEARRTVHHVGWGQVPRIGPQGLVQLVKERTCILLVTGSTPEGSRICDYASWIRACRA